ncbi:MAG: hypothetical protein WBN39_00825 [Flavobacteriaceae bacterium]
MEPNKFEKHIRKQLLERKFTPAPESWDKVVQKLEASERPKSNRYFLAGIAAGFIGLLIVLGIFFKEDSPNPAPVDKMVLAPVEQKEGQERSTNEEGVLFDKNGQNQIAKTNVATPEFENKANAVRSRSATGSVHKPAQPSPKLAHIASQILPADSTANMIALKLAEVVAHIEVIEKELATGITDVEVDSLLLNAQMELMADQMFPKPNKVNPAALLATVEEELDQSFRDQILDKLKSGFEKVRTAVAQRND